MTSPPDRVRRGHRRRCRVQGCAERAPAGQIAYVGGGEVCVHLCASHMLRRRYLSVADLKPVRKPLGAVYEGEVGRG